MRVLNAVLPEAAIELGLPVSHKAGWLEGYLSALREIGDVTLTTVTRTGSVAQESEVSFGGVRHVVLPKTAVDVTAPLTAEATDEYRQVLHAASPDLVHFHGSEYHYGLLAAQGHIAIPAVLSIQGLMNACHRVYFGGLSVRDILRAHTPGEIIHRTGIWGGWRQFGRRATIEGSIIQGIPHIIGRTRWDRAHVREINPFVHYYHCDEIMRPPFYHTKREVARIQPFSILASTASYPLKGFHCLLRAVALLKKDFPSIGIRLTDSQNPCAGSSGGYQRFLCHLIRTLGLSAHIEWLGTLDAASMATALAESHLFVNPSFIENRSNSLAEAMLVGVPSVASLAGGMTSTVKDGATALCFPPGDCAMLAECIRMLFLDDALAQRLATNAQALARRRHDPAQVGQKLMSIYQAVAQRDLVNATSRVD